MIILFGSLHAVKRKQVPNVSLPKVSKPVDKGRVGYQFLAISTPHRAATSEWRCKRGMPSLPGEPGTSYLPVSPSSRLDRIGVLIGHQMLKSGSFHRIVNCPARS